MIPVHAGDTMGLDTRGTEGLCVDTIENESTDAVVMHLGSSLQRGVLEVP